jgi:hypothetical protein
VLPVFARTSSIVRHESYRALRTVGLGVEYGRNRTELLDDFIRANIAWS